MKRMISILLGLVAAVVLAGCTPANGQTSASQDADDLPAAEAVLDSELVPVIETIQPVDNTDLELVNSCNREPGSGVMVTFDDKGSPEQVEAILDVLDELDWRGAFFPIGEWALDNQGLIQEMQRRGHIVGNHTMTHPDLMELLATDADAFFGEIYPLEGVATTSPMLLRPPYGSGLGDPTVAELLTEKDTQLCGWTADTNDWRGGTAAELLERVMEGYEFSEALQPDGVVLAHMNQPNTVEFVRLLAAELDERGWSRAPLK